MSALFPQDGQRFRERGFAFADHDHIRALLQVLDRVVAGLRPAHDHDPSVLLRVRDDFHDNRARHQIGVEAQYAARFAFQPRKQFGAAAQRAVVERHIIMRPFEIGG
jgi:hypothetical protein